MNYVDEKRLIKSLRLLWKRYQRQKIDDDELIGKLERILYMSGVCQE